MKIKYFLLVTFVLIVLFIWGNSLLPPEVSGQISGTVKDFLTLVLGDAGGSENDVELHFWVRKLAHFFEFFALGTVGALLLRFYSRDLAQRWCYIAIIGLFFALTDETLQLFSARGSSVRDVWIDLCGYLAGCFFAELLIIFRKKLISGRKKQT
jgi:VanZ family protein